MKRLMNRWTAFILIVSCMCSYITVYAESDTKSQDDSTIKDYIQQYDETQVHDKQLIIKTTGIDVSSILAQQGITGYELVKTYPEKNIFVVCLKGQTDSEQISEMLYQLNNDSNIVYAQRDSKFFLEDAGDKAEEIWKIQNTNQVLTPNTNYENLIKLRQAHRISQGRENILVGVIDSGIDINHDAIKHSIYKNEGESSNSTDSDMNGYADDISGWDFVHHDSSVYDMSLLDYHGTQIAGIIAGQNDSVMGVAPNVKLLPLKAFNYNSGYTSDILEAIIYAQYMGVQIVNCSFSSIEYNPAIADVISQSNMLFVCAVGNYGETAENYVTYPACYGFDNVISVSAVDQNGERCAFSSYGHDTVAAPGKDIYAASPENQYQAVSGTSYAAAYVSGAAALLKSVYPDYSLKQIKKVFDYSGGGEENILDVLNILKQDSSLSTTDLSVEPEEEPVNLQVITKDEAREKGYPFRVKQSGLNDIRIYPVNGERFQECILSAGEEEITGIYDESDASFTFPNLTLKKEYDVYLICNHEQTIYDGKVKISFICGYFQPMCYNIDRRSIGEEDKNLFSTPDAYKENEEDGNNDTKDLADEIQTYHDCIDGSLCDTDTVDFYSFVCDTDTTCTFTVPKESVQDICIDLYLYQKKNDTPIAKDEQKRNPKNKREIAQKQLEAGETYYLQVQRNPKYSKERKAPEEYTVNITRFPPADQYEPNNKYDIPTRLPSNNIDITANIHCPSDEDYYAFNVDRPSDVEISITPPAGHKYQFQVEDLTSQRMVQKEHTTRCEYSTNVYSPGVYPKTYLIKVEDIESSDGYNPSHYGSPYKLSIDTKGADWKQIPLNKIQTVQNVVEQGYKLIIPSDGKYVFRTMANDNSTSNTDTKLELFDSNQQSMITNDDIKNHQSLSSNGFSEIEADLHKGTYYLMLSGYRGSSISCDLLAEECKVKTIGSSQFGRQQTISPCYAAYYDITPAQTGLYTIKTQNNKDADTVLYLYDETGKFIEKNDNWEGKCSKIVYSLKANTTYHIKVSAASYMYSGENIQVQCGLSVTKNSETQGTVNTDAGNSGSITSGDIRFTIDTPENDETIMGYSGSFIIAGKRTNIYDISVTVNNEKITDIDIGNTGYNARYFPTQNGKCDIKIEGVTNEGKKAVLQRTVYVLVYDEGSTAQFASAIYPNSEIRGAIDQKSDVDYFNLLCYNQGEYTITVSTPQFDNSVKIELRDEKDKLIKTGQFTDDHKMQIVHTLAANKRYYIRIECNKDTWSRLQVYTLKIASSSGTEVVQSAETITVDGVRYVSEPFDAAEKLYKLVLNDDMEYAIESVGGDEYGNITEAWLYNADEYERTNGKCSHLAYNANFAGGRDFLLTCNGGQGYYLKIKKRYDQPTQLRIAKTGLSDLAYEKDTGSHYIFVNNPEFLTALDTIYSEDGNLIYTQSGVTGNNALYATHIIKQQNEQAVDEKLEHDVYYDIDFYNPSNEPVNITVSRLAYGAYTNQVNTWGGMEILSDFFNVEMKQNQGFGSAPRFDHTPQQRRNIKLTVPPGGHRLLTNGNLYISADSYKNSTVPFFLMTDFTVERGKNITVSAIADQYNPGKTELVYEQPFIRTQDNILQIPWGKLLPSRYYYEERDKEKDIAVKMKGMDTAGGRKVSAKLDFVLKGSYPALQLFQTDSVYRGKWSSGRNAVWTPFANPYLSLHGVLNLSSPSAFSAFEFTNQNRIDTGGLSSAEPWKFVYDRVTGMGIDRPGLEKDSYTNGKLTDVKHAGSSKTAEEELLAVAEAGDESGYPAWFADGDEGYMGDYPNSITNIGEWGKEYEYTVSFKNPTNAEKKVALKVATSHSVAVIVNENGERKLWTVMEADAQGGRRMYTIGEPFTVPANSEKTIRFSIVYTMGAADIICALEQIQ